MNGTLQFVDLVEQSLKMEFTMGDWYYQQNIQINPHQYIFTPYLNKVNLAKREIPNSNEDLSKYK